VVEAKFDSGNHNIRFANLSPLVLRFAMAIRRNNFLDNPLLKSTKWTLRPAETTTGC
jgi:hypothetical protein